jgi:opacity protein-like surface antigen
MLPTSRARRTFAVALVTALAVASAAAGAPLYLRGAAGWERSEDTTLDDLDCTSSVPPALFGCGAGVDGRPLAARGDFGDGPLLELAVGAELGERWRLELELSARPDLDLAAEANFRGVSGAQPASAGGRSTTALLRAVMDLGAPELRWRPFVAAGIGAARNELDEVVYSFPSIAPGALTRVEGGTHTDLAWSAAAGVAIRLAPRLFLDLEARYSDLGQMRTDVGTATIVRPRGTIELTVAGSEADLATAGAIASLRWRIGSTR